MRLRLSILRLMALVLFAAIGLAAAMAGAFAFAVVMLSAATLGALLRRGPSRAFFVGASLCGWAFLLLVFGGGREVFDLPTVRPILRAYEALYGPGPTAFATQEDAQRWVVRLIADINWAITTGHSLMALALALIGGTVAWLIAHWRRGDFRRSRPRDLVGGPGA